MTRSDTKMLVLAVFRDDNNTIYSNDDIYTLAAGDY